MADRPSPPVMVGAVALALVSSAPVSRGADPPPVDVIPYAGLPAARAAEVMRLPPGFSVKVIAAEPDLVQPVAFAIDDRGRLWVAQDLSYPVRAPEGEGRDSILIFEDSDGDGTFDRRTVFAEGLNLVMGLEVGHGGVWVGAPPYLLFIPLTPDGNRAARPPEVVLDGFGYQDTHNTMSTFKWGPDGWLYGGHGIATRSRVGRPGTPDQDRVALDGAVWRYHPQKKRFEVFARGFANPWGLDFDEHGQLLATGCVLPHAWHVVEGGRYRRLYGSNGPRTYGDIDTIADHVHWDSWSQRPHDVNNRSAAAGGGHAHAGGMIYLGGSWPAEYRNRLFTFNLHGHRVNTDRLERSGSGFVAHHGPDFLMTQDRSSIVLNLQYGPDGSVYMIDWYDNVTCHNSIPDAWDRSNGRIYRIDYGPHRPRLVDLARLSGAALVDRLQDDNDWYVQHARRILAERGPDPAVRRKVAALLARTTVPSRRLRLIWALHVTGGLPEPLALSLLKDPSEEVRAWTIQLVTEDAAPPDRVRAALERLAATDSSAMVRLYLASAAGRLPVAGRRALVLPLARAPDVGSDRNLPLMIWYAAEPVVATDPQVGLQLLRQARIPLVRQFVARALTEAGHAGPLEALARERDPSHATDVLRGIDAALEIDPPLAAPAGWARTSARLLEGAPAETRALVLGLSLRFRAAGAAEGLRAIVVNPAEDVTWRRRALAALRRERSPLLLGTLKELLPDRQLRGEALNAFANVVDETVPAAILESYGAMNAAERLLALGTLASREIYARELVRAVEKGTVPRADLGPIVIRQLRAFDDREMKDVLARVWGVARDGAGDKNDEIKRYLRIWRAGGSLPGDASRGRMIFARSCQPCHKLFDTGGAVGPELTGANRGDLEYLLQNIVDPNAFIANDFRSWTVETKDGRFLVGLLRKREAEALTIQTVADTVVLPTREVKTATAGETSLMPEGLLAGLRDQDVRDLLQYLRQPGQVPLPD